MTTIKTRPPHLLHFVPPFLSSPFSHLHSSTVHNQHIITTGPYSATPSSNRSFLFHLHYSQVSLLLTSVFQPKSLGRLTSSPLPKIRFPCSSFLFLQCHRSLTWSPLRQLHNNAVQPPLWFLDTPARTRFLRKAYVLVFSSTSSRPFVVNGK